MVATAPSHRVVIIGSGFGGLFAARALRRAPVSVTVVDRTNHHLFQPLLYQVATGILSEGSIARPTRDVLRWHADTAVLQAIVTDIDLERRVVISRQPDRVIELPYDSLVVAAGTRTSYFDHPEFARFATGMKSLDDALELRGRIFGAFEMAEAEPDPASRGPWLTFVVVGGGPTGVEMAGQIAELSRRSLQHNFRRIDPRDARIIVVEGGDRLLASFSPRLSKITARDLGRLGVEVMTNTMVVAMDGTSIDVRLADGTTTTLASCTKVWAAGMSASPLGAVLAAASDAPTDRAGRVRVNPDCTLPGHPEVFVIGDLMALDDLPGVAEVAMQSAIHAAWTIRRRLDGDDTARSFRYRDLGNVAVISRFGAVAQLGRLSVSGFTGWLVWLVVHLTFLTGFKNRIGALAHWAVSFVGRDRAERAISYRQIVAREAIAALTAQGGPADNAEVQQAEGTPR